MQKPLNRAGDYRARATWAGEIRRFPRSRRYVTAAFRNAHLMHGLISVDVTDALAAVRSAVPPPSVTALVIACVARSAQEHREVHAYRDWRGRLVVPGHVDVATLVESPTSETTFPLAHLLRDAETRSVGDLSAEIRAVAADRSSSPSGRLLPWVESVPIPYLLVKAAYRAAGRSRALRKVTGTVTVSAVGMFGRGGGFGIGVPSTASLTVLVGGVARRPWVVDGGGIEPRDVLDLTISADHAIVDGAPLARFVAELRTRLETAGRWLPEEI